MPYCKYCHRLYDEVYIRKATVRTARFMNQFTRYHDLSIYDNICLACIETEMKVCAQRMHKKIIDDKNYIVMDDESNSRYNDATRCGYNSPVDRSNDIKFYLRYMETGKEVAKTITAYFLLDTKLQIVIKYMIDNLKLCKSCQDIVLTHIINNRRTICKTNYTLSTTLRMLDVNENAFLCFKDSTEENIKHNGAALKASSDVPSLSITIYYSRYKTNFNYELPYDTTVQYLFSAVIQSFHLNNIDISRLQLKSPNNDLNIDSRVDKKLVDLGIGTKYQLLFLFTEAEESTIEKKIPDMLNQVSQLHTKRYIKINSSLLQQTLNIDLVTVRFLIDLKQKVIDQYKKETQASLHANDIRLSLNGINFGESDDTRLLWDLKIHEETELQAHRVIRANKPINEENQRLASTQDKFVRSEVDEYSLLRRTDPVGLYNLGNTCFLNSALQCLSHVAPLTLFFLNELSKTHTNNGHSLIQIDNYGKMTNAYAEFVWNMWKGELPQFSPSRIRNILGRIAPPFSTYEQQDAQELMVFLLNIIHNEMQNDKKDDNTIIKNLFYNTIQSTTTCLKCKTNPRITSNVISFLPISLIQDKRSFKIQFIRSYGSVSIRHIAVPSNGLVKDLVQAFIEENHLRYRLIRVSPTSNFNEQYPVTKLLCEIFEDEVAIIDDGYNPEGPNYSSIAQTEDKLTLYHCIRQFVAPEIMKKNWFCKDECNGTHAVKQMQLCSLSRVLIVQLKRFTDENGYMRKIDKYLDFPINGLDSSKFHSDTTHHHLNVVYDLIAVSNHMGSAYGGHYTAYARQGVGEPWYLFDDSRVTPLQDEDRIVSRNAYILLYLQRENHENEIKI